VYDVVVKSLRSLSYLVMSFLCVDDSAKVAADNEITPQSNYVIVLPDGTCIWQPRFDLAVSQCSVDVTWFPFDEQKCHLFFESWLMQNDSLELETTTGYYTGADLETQGWLVIGVY